MLPIMFIIIKALFSNKKYFLLTGVTALIVMGVVFKCLSILYTNSQDTYSGTHNRIDALGWGVLLGIIIHYGGGGILKT